MVQFKSFVFIIMAVLVVSGCTGGQDVTPIVKALPEVQQFLKEHPNAKITVTYWSKEDVGKIAGEISQQCDKPITQAAMYKAVISEGELKSIAWIDAETRTLICSTTEGKGGTPAPTQTATYTPVVTTPVIAQTSTPASTPTATPAPMTPAPTPTSISLPSSKTMTAGETWDLGNGYTLTMQGIDAFGAPRMVLIVFSKDGIKFDEAVLFQGNTYTYGRIFSTKIASIYPIKNPEGALPGVGAARLDNSTLTPASNPAQTVTATPAVTATATPVVTTPAPTPIIQVYQDPISYDFSSNWAGTSLLRGVSIWNAGGGTLTWSASADQPWITPDPTSGTNSGWIAFNISTVGLSAGTHSGTITITSNGGTKTGIISLTVSQSLPTPTPTPAPQDNSSLS